MSNRMLRRCRAAVPVALAVAVSSFAGAKPPDLPTVSREAVAPQAGSRQVDVVDPDCEDKPLETAVPVERLTVMPTEIEVIRVKPVGVDKDPRLAAARRLYLIGERCRREGDLDMAVNCYHETHLLCPASGYGRKARQKLKQVEARRAAVPAPAEAEEQEPPRPLPQHLVAPPEGGKPSEITIELDQVQSAPAGQTQEPPVATKPAVLIVPLPPRDLTIYVDEPETYGSTSSLLREVSDIMLAAAGVDIDLEIAAGHGGGLRACGSIQAGKLGCKVLYEDCDGHTTLVVVPSKP